MPSVADVISELEFIPAHIKQEYIPAASEWLAGLWVKLIGVSNLLGTIISEFYKQEKPLPSKDDLEQYEKDLLQLAVSIDTRVYKDSLALLHTYQYQLFYELVAQFRRNSRSADSVKGH